MPVDGLYWFIGLRASIWNPANPSSFFIDMEAFLFFTSIKVPLQGFECMPPSLFKPPPKISQYVPSSSKHVCKKILVTT